MPVVKQRFYLFIFAIFFVIIIIAGVVVSSTAPKTVAKPTPTPANVIVTPQPTLGPPPTIAFTVKSAVGVNTITITNQNTGAKIILTAAELPATYNVKYGDTMSFTVSAASGYKFNAWVFGDSTFQSQNPYTAKVTYPFTMEARFLMVMEIG